MKNKSTISITLDMDWAPEEIIDYSLKLLSQYNVTATLFMTNKISCHISQHEIAIHPNFRSMKFEKHFTKYISIYPNIKGMRSHSLFFSERFRPFYKKFGIEYQSNVMMHCQKNIIPYYMSPTTLEIPIFWMDSYYLENISNNQTVFLNNKSLEAPGLKVFDFHPIHIFLNTDTLSFYASVKKYYKNPEKIAKYRNKHALGICDIFIKLLKYLKNNSLPCYTLGEISHHYRKLL